MKSWQNINISCKHSESRIFSCLNLGQHSLLLNFSTPKTKTKSRFKKNTDKNTFFLLLNCSYFVNYVTYKDLLIGLKICYQYEN